MNYLTQKIFNQTMKVYSLFNSEDSISYNNSILTPQQGNDQIKAIIMKGKPALVCRLGSTELMTMANYLGIENYEKNGVLGLHKNLRSKLFPYWKEDVLHNICVYSGFFPKDEELIKKYAKSQFACLKSADYVGVWSNFYEDKICNTYCPNAVLSELCSIEPYFHYSPWSKALAGKNVLVVHPNATSISQNYCNSRTKLFVDQNVLPEFDLSVVQAVQSIANSAVPYKDWFEALESMKNKIENINYDIAIIGAGAYGLPLANFVKQQGKIAIHIGGATQILFGIKGKRWDSMPEVSKFYNQYWTYPLPEETPNQHLKIENGCYW